ncbi:MAG: mechanosensitive ion channel protein MscS [Ignavibacteriae bacterium HGW-Ignavibacteriae-2]|nr:MAG: mechanosensitive ion channel protein MscS [Ignavibacteriae bacterium HGW-Ignavibacteriae-2]
MTLNWQNEILKYTIIIVVTTILAAVTSKLLRAVLDKFIHTSSKVMNVDETNYNFFKNAITFFVYSIAVLIIFNSIPALKDFGVTMLASAGILAAILGFASQEAFSNIISGVFIVLFKPFRVGDNIKINENGGIIEDITLRHTIIRNFENRRLIIPNSVINSAIILNSTISDPKICNFLEMGISYDSNIDKAMEIIVEEALKHPNFYDNRTKEEIAANSSPVLVRVLGYGDSAINLRAYIWSKDSGEGFQLKCDLYKSIKTRFDDEEIEIPFPYRTIVYKKEVKKTEN